MSDTLTLFETAPHPRARAADPITSLDAAKSITPGRTEARIMDAFAALDPGRRGLTDDELLAVPMLWTGYDRGTVKTARSRLSKAGLLVDSGVRRPSIRGRSQTVWVAR